jgi:hypothetical protein
MAAPICDGHRLCVGKGVVDWHWHIKGDGLGHLGGIAALLLRTRSSRNNHLFPFPHICGENRRKKSAQDGENRRRLWRQNLKLEKEEVVAIFRYYGHSQGNVFLGKCRIEIAAQDEKQNGFLFGRVAIYDSTKRGRRE